MKNHELFSAGEFVREFESNQALFGWLRKRELELILSPKTGGWDVQTENKQPTAWTVNPGFEFPRQNHCLQSMYNRQMAYFIKCVNEDIDPIPGGGEGRINLAVIDAAYRSAHSENVEEVRC